MLNTVLKKQFPISSSHARFAQDAKTQRIQESHEIPLIILFSPLRLCVRPHPPFPLPVKKQFPISRELSRVSTRWTSLGVSLENSQPLGKGLAAHAIGVFVEVTLADGFMADLANALLAEGAADLLRVPLTGTELGGHGQSECWRNRSSRPRALIRIYLRGEMILRLAGHPSLLEIGSHAGRIHSDRPGDEFLRAGVAAQAFDGVTIFSGQSLTVTYGLGVSVWRTNHKPRQPHAASGSLPSPTLLR